jgi:sodium transport system ATP-binding protein
MGNGESTSTLPRSSSPEMQSPWHAVPAFAVSTPHSPFSIPGVAMIEVQALHKSFTTAKTVVKAVDGVSFEARDGEITGLLGPNGAGKTTTLRMLYTLMKPDSGRVLVDGHDTAAEAEAVRRALGVLPDARGVYKRLTARENIAYFGELHGLDAATIATRTDNLVRALNMQDFIDRRTEGFSQGQRTKTAIARALVHDPGNVILDEPTNGLDVMTTRGLREFLKQLRAEGRCVVFSSHIMQEVAALCDRIVIIARGQVVASGTADELRTLTGEENLEDAFVKAIGSDEGLHA